jgi:SPP1 family predicted phage head-tail adaptor
MADVIGRMDRRVTIEAPVTAKDASGSVSTTWSALHSNIHARVQQAPGREALAGNALQADADVVFTVRWRTGIDSTCRVLWDGTYYAVVGEPVQIGRQDRLEIKARRIPAEAV